MPKEPSTGPEPGAPGAFGSAQTSAPTAAESYVWPLTTLLLVILPQVLVPEKMREGPPLGVPAIEAMVVLILLAVAAKPGPVPRAERQPAGVRPARRGGEEARDPGAGPRGAEIGRAHV